MLLLNCHWTKSESSWRAVRRCAHVQGLSQWAARELWFSPEGFCLLPLFSWERQGDKGTTIPWNCRYERNFKNPHQEELHNKAKHKATWNLVGGGKKKNLIIKCCLCKMKNHTVPSGHNSPGEPSTYVTRQEAKLMHRRGAAAAHANSTGNLLCKAHSPCMAFHAGVRYLTKSSALTEDSCLSHFCWNEDLPDFPLLPPMLVPCSPLDNLLAFSIH